MFLFDIPIEKLVNTSYKTKSKLKSLQIASYYDLINYFPYRYEHYDKKISINQLASIIKSLFFSNQTYNVTIKGKVKQINNIYTKSKITIQKAIIIDKTGSLEAVWFNQRYLMSIIQKGQLISISGRLEPNQNPKIFYPLEYEILNDINQPTIHTGNIIPVYSETAGISTKTIREKIYRLLKYIPDIIEFIPDNIIRINKLENITTAYKQIHFPDNIESLNKAKKRLAFNELFILQLSSALIKQKWRQKIIANPMAVKQYQKDIDDFINRLPFGLTSSQLKTLSEIISDLSGNYPMNRLLQGDVGSGKTIVAIIAGYLTYLNQKEILIMTPTEILSKQHYRSISNFFSKINSNNKMPKIELITSSIKTDKRHLLKSDIIIGTHALLAKKINFENVGFVVIDEQHKFGVIQRALLKKKAGNSHLLTMTATPIPRTVSLTFYGELDLSIIDEMPKNRIITKSYLISDHKRMDAYNWIKTQIVKKGSQVFIVCPLIEESSKDTLKSVKAAKKEYEYLKINVFNKFRIELLHGQMKPKDKDRIITDFINKNIDILVTTSVVEVGVDIPNVNVIVIEAAERYGLAQLHQLRGRVGRGNSQAYCLLFTNNTQQNVLKRLKLFANTNNGFRLAEFDLKNRGIGQIYGTEQHGHIKLKIADLADLNLINQVKSAVTLFINSKYKINDYPYLYHEIKKIKTDSISRD